MKWILCDMAYCKIDRKDTFGYWILFHTCGNLGFSDQLQHVWDGEVFHYGSESVTFRQGTNGELPVPIMIGLW